MHTPKLQIDTNKVLAREVDGELVLLEIERQLYFGGSHSAAVLWPLLEEGATRDQLLEALEERYEVERDQLAEDLDEFLDGLAEHGLLGTSEPAP